VIITPFCVDPTQKGVMINGNATTTRKEYVPRAPSLCSNTTAPFDTGAVAT
jgi:hypothetical protein